MRSSAASGINCVGVAPDGRHLRFPALGAITGDWGGGYDVGLAAVFAGARSEDGRGPDQPRARRPCATSSCGLRSRSREAIHGGQVASRGLIELAPRRLRRGGARRGRSGNRRAPRHRGRRAGAVAITARLDLAPSRSRCCWAEGCLAQETDGSSARSRKACATSGDTSWSTAPRRPRRSRALRPRRARSRRGGASAGPRRARGCRRFRRGARGGGIADGRRPIRAGDTRLSWKRRPGRRSARPPHRGRRVHGARWSVRLGKSTALRMLAGLEDVDEGGIWVGGRDVTYARPKNRDVAMVFQNYALYPYLTVAANIGFPLKVAKVAGDERDRRVREVAEMLGLGDLLERSPPSSPAASASESRWDARSSPAQRLPHGRAALEPRRQAARPDARGRRGLQARLGVTTVYVTHDQAEAMTLGHRVAVLKDGRLQQCAAPREPVRPTHEHLRRRLHRLTRDEPVHGPRPNGSVPRRSVALGAATSARSRLAASAAASSAFGPRRLEVAADGIPAVVEVVEELGADSYVFCLGGRRWRSTAHGSLGRAAHPAARRHVSRCARVPAKPTSSIPRPGSASRTEMTRGAIQPPDVATPKAPYSPVVVSGDHVYTAGQVAFDATGAVVAMTMEAQTRRALENLRSCLAAAGCGLDDVVKVNAYLGDLATSTSTTRSTASSSPSPIRHGPRCRQGSRQGSSSRSRRSPDVRRELRRSRRRRRSSTPTDSERNLARWQEHCDRHGLANRPHVKTHRCVEIARRQLSLGAVGITCQKLSEAETMADAGLRRHPRAVQHRRRRQARAPARPARAGHARGLGRRRSAPARASPRRRRGVARGWACSSTATRASAGRASRAPRRPRTSPSPSGHEGLRFDGFLTPPRSRRCSSALLEAAAAGVGNAGSSQRWCRPEGRPRCGRAVRCARRDRVSSRQLRLLRPHVDRGRCRLLSTTLRSRCTRRRQPAGAGSSNPRRGLQGADVGDPARRPRFGLVLEAPNSVIVKLAKSTPTSNSRRTSSSSASGCASSRTTVASWSASSMSWTITRNGRVEATWRVDARSRSEIERALISLRIGSCYFHDRGEALGLLGRPYSFFES